MGAVTHENAIIRLNGEAAAMQPYRRLKLSTSDTTKWVYADKLDYTNFFAVSDVVVGNLPAVGADAPGLLISPRLTYKVCASGAITAGALVYADDDGKVSATIAGEPLGIALTASAADGGLCEVVFFGPLGAKKMTIMQSLSASGDTVINKPNWKCRIASAYFISRDTSAANFTLKNGSTAITDTIAKGTANDTVKNFTTFVTAAQTLLTTDTLNGTLSAAQAVEVIIQFVPA